MPTRQRSWNETILSISYFFGVSLTKHVNNVRQDVAGIIGAEEWFHAVQRAFFPRVLFHSARMFATKRVPLKSQGSELNSILQHVRNRQPHMICD